LTAFENVLIPMEIAGGVTRMRAPGNCSAKWS
jgi:hypothetical protein